MATALAGIPIRNTRTVLNEDSKYCTLIYSPPKFGKTTLCATLDKLTKKYMGKPSLFIATESAEGGGTVSIQDFGIDYVQPTSLNDIEKLIGALGSDTMYGGVVVDGTYDLVGRFLKPYALNFPSREKVPTRAAGVPERSDYQTMGEKLREILNRLVNLTVHPDLNIRKHLIVTALEKDKYEDDGKTLVAIQPHLPGAMADTATGIFQTVGSIQLKTTVGKDPTTGQPTRTISRVLVTSPGSSKRIVGDRTGLFPAEGPADLLDIWEKYWLPGLEKRKIQVPVAPSV